MQKGYLINMKKNNIYEWIEDTRNWKMLTYLCRASGVKEKLD